MKKIVIVIVLTFTFISMQAQKEVASGKLTKLAKSLDSIVKQEKGVLKDSIVLIEKQLELGKISEDEAREKKEEFANEIAERITKESEEKTDEILAVVDEIINEKTTGVSAKFSKKLIHSKKEKNKKPKRTVSRFVFAYGLNTIIDNGSPEAENILDYKLWQSNSVELGWAYKTRLIKESSLLNLKYGVSFLWNSYSPKDNLYHVEAAGVTHLENHTADLSKSKLRSSYVVVPVFLEFDFSKTKTVNDKIKLQRNKSVRVGLGGYAGLKMFTKQFLEYKNEVGDIKETIKASYDMERYKYGVSGYLGYKDMSFFANYDLNTLFSNTPEQNLTMGVRFDW